MIRKSFGKELTASWQTIYEVPDSKKAEWVMLYCVNGTGSTDDFSARISYADSTTLDIFVQEQMADGEFFRMGGTVNDFIALNAGDKIEAKNGSSGFSFLVSVIEEPSIIQGG